MSFRLVKGKFQLVYFNEKNHRRGSDPDGDSVWFMPDNSNHLKELGGRFPKYNKGGLINLRFESIDALELHYGGNHQNANGAVASRDFMLKSLGFSSVTFAPSSKIPTRVRTSKPKSVTGYIYTRTIDTYQRPVSFIFKGKTQRKSGQHYSLTASEIGKSVNAKLIANGQAFPAFYSSRQEDNLLIGGLPKDLRLKMTQLMQEARHSKLGVWKLDKTQKGFKAKNEKELSKLVIWPKIFRRIQEFLGTNPSSSSSSAFLKWLETSKSNDVVYVISQAETYRMSDLLKIQSGKIKMLFPPEDIMIVPT